MDKEEFRKKLEDVREVRGIQKNLLRERAKLLYEYDATSAKIGSGSTAIKLFCIIPAFLGWGLANAVLTSIDADVNGLFIAAFLLSGVICYAVTYIVLKNIFVLPNSKKHESRCNIIKDSIVDKTREIAKTNNEISLKLNEELSPKYCVYAVFDTIIGYFKDGRVDNTKEAVNLFIQEYGEADPFLYADDEGSVNNSLAYILKDTID